MSGVIAAVLIIVGAAFTCVAGIGILRMPDVFIRMHASTKVGTLGSGLIMAGTAVHFAEPVVVFKGVLVVLFLDVQIQRLTTTTHQQQLTMVLVSSADVQTQQH